MKLSANLTKPLLFQIERRKHVKSESKKEENKTKQKNAHLEFHGSDMVMFTTAANPL